MNQISPLSASGASESPIRDAVVCIHGTFAYHADDAVMDGCDRWWQEGSSFATRVVESAAVECPIKLQSEADDLRIFRWSGENRESIRRIAGERLHEHLCRLNEKCANEARRFHVVAHSHGGNVLWHALLRAQSSGEDYS